MLTAEEVEFIAWPKIRRLEKVQMVVTEKIDGTNAAIGVTEDREVWAQSRTKIITPGKGNDNAGFAAWVSENEPDLANQLGPGLHFGEWWGKGIQRGYDLEEKRFSLFNTGRWTSVLNDFGEDPFGLESTRCIQAPLCHVVPLLSVYRTLDTAVVRDLWNTLRLHGSLAAPGYDRPEGVCAYLTEVGVYMKLSDAKLAPGV